MELAEIVKEFLHLSWSLVLGYVTHGLFFAIIHVFVAYLVYRSWHGKIELETDALELWVPPHRRALTTVKAGETTRVLDRFVEESQKLGPQGFFVPMTDYSDRLDSIIDGMVAELHDRTNLFILVGIAGTLFGVFEFAFRSHEVALNQALDPGLRVQKLGEFLSDSMSKAFPVGFMGLVLTFLSQIVAAIPERRLREALSKATREALKCRAEDSISQAEIVRESADAIREAMQPISSLESTLTNSLQPVVEKFGESLEQSLKLVRFQFDQLQTATQSIHTAVASVQQGVASLELAAGEMKTLLEGAPKAIRSLDQLGERQQQFLTGLDASLQTHIIQSERINSGLNAATEGLLTLPQELIHHTKNALDSIGRESLLTWQSMSIEFSHQLRSDYSAVLTKINTQAAEIRDAVGSLSQRMNEVSIDASNALSSLNKLPDSVLKGLEASFGSLSERALETWKNTSDSFGADIHSTYVNYLQTITSEAQKARESLDTAGESWGRLGSNANTFLKDAAAEIVTQARRELEGSFTHLEQLLASRLPEVSTEVQKFAGGLQELLSQVQMVQREYASWLGGAQTAQAAMRDIHAQLIRVRDDLQTGKSKEDNGEVARILQHNTQQLEASNRLLEQIQNRIPRSGNGIQEELQSSISLLKDIRNGVDEMAHKEGMLKRVAKRWPWPRDKH